MKKNNAFVCGVFAAAMVVVLAFTACEQPTDKPSGNKTVTSIAVTTGPAKTVYVIGETIDLGGLVVTATYSNGKTEAVTVTAENISGFDSATAGEKTVTVTYGGKTADFTVTVKEVASIAVTAGPTKTVYAKGERIDLGGMVITATFGDGTTGAARGYTVSGFDSSTTGTKTVTVTYGGKTATFTVTVKELVSIAVTAGPTKTVYAKGEKLDLGGLVVTATYSDNETEDVTGYATSGFDSATTGKKTVTVTYGGKTAAFTVAVQEVASIEITTQPLKTTYAVGETIDLSGLVVTATFSDNETEEVTITPANISGFDSTTVGSKTVIVSYGGKTDTFNVTIKGVSSIEITTLPVKTTYAVGEAIDLSGLVVTATFTDTSTETATITAANISGFDSSTAGTNTVTVTYGGKTATFNVTIKGVSSIAVTTQPTKIVYIVGETIDLGGLVVTATFTDNSTETATITLANISGFDSSTTGTKTVTINLGGKTTSFNVTVNPKNVSALTIDAIASQTYTGSAITPAVTVKDGATTLTLGTHYTAAYTSNTNVGTATVTVTGTGNYTGTRTVNFTIAKATPAAADYNISGNSITYDGSAKAVSVVAKTGKSGGTVTVYYTGISPTTYAKSTTAPTNTGSYAVTFDVAASGDGNWNTATGLSAGTLTISLAAAPVAGDFNVSNLSQRKIIDETIAAVTVTAKAGKTNGAVTVYYAGISPTSYAKSTTVPQIVGTFAVTFDVAQGSNYAAASDLNAGTLTVIDYLSSIDELNTWLAGKATNTAATAYTVKLNTNLSTSTNITSLRTTLNGNANKYVNLNLSGSTITAIPENAFYGTASPYGCATLVGITLPSGVTSIGNYAFRESGLTGVTIPATVTSIGNGPFTSCTGLSAITVDTANANYSSDNGVLYNKAKTTLIQYPAGKTSTTFTIPSTVTTIGNYAFYQCTKLTSTLTIPNTVTSIGEYSFYGCTGFTGITFTATSKVTTIGNLAFYQCSGLTGTLTIPNSVTTIGNNAFYQCTGLTGVTIGTGVTSIEYYAFLGCSKLATVTFTATSKVASIGNNAFQNCAYTSITIPASVTSIGTNALSNTATTVIFQGGNITAANFSAQGDPFNDLRTKYLAGHAGTYTRPNTSSTSVWTKQ